MIKVKALHDRLLYRTEPRPAVDHNIVHHRCRYDVNDNRFGLRLDIVTSKQNSHMSKSRKLH